MPCYNTYDVDRDRLKQVEHKENGHTLHRHCLPHAEKMAPAKLLLW